MTRTRYDPGVTKTFSTYRVYRPNVTIQEDNQHSDVLENKVTFVVLLLRLTDLLQTSGVNVLDLLRREVSYRIPMTNSKDKRRGTSEEKQVSFISSSLRPLLLFFII